jgi:hypothetical protein
MSLHDKSILVAITLGGMPSSRIDKDTTAFVLRSQSAKDEAGRWTARLWPKEALEPIRSIDSRIRAYHYSKTLPWLDDGKRILASRVFNDYSDHLRSLRFEREQTVYCFLDNYENWIDRARDMRGTAFDASEYPSRNKAQSKFRFDINAEPVPSSGDFRISLAAPDMERIQAELDTRIAAAEECARRDLYGRIAAPIAALLDRLTDPDSRITDATLNSVRELVDAIPDLNVWDDPDIAALRERIAMGLATLRPDSLKESRSDRSRAASKASSILASMAPWLGAEAIEAAA